MTRGNLREMRRRCEATARALPLPQPFDARALCERVAQQRGRPITLTPMNCGDSGVLGLWVAAKNADMIFYEASTTPPHQEHIILHELSHVLCDHYPARLSDNEMLRLLMPNLNPSMVRRILGRTSYDAAEEQEAELLASLIRQRAQREAMPGHGTDVAGRINAAFGWPESHE
ncbi:ImmA/IrrE family metallo-endopeptidase [Kibdelosporangium aridum]|uniref:ImmA/IrrE family metallo-endopeptidase n=2 Tax=Kibdelosporangium aridum TaxID=2030 RepID=A0A428ZNF9_KIBAR|nr:ImmA/IrrE family metallo-endopeptidase [Kibdelosporangium aridum]